MKEKKKIIVTIAIIIVMSILFYVGYKKGYIIGFYNEPATKYYSSMNLNPGEYTELDSSLKKDIQDNKVVLESSDDNVASVDEDGNIQARSKGRTTIKVKDENNNVIKEIEVIVDDKTPSNAQDEPVVNPNQSKDKTEPTVEPNKPKDQNESTVEPNENKEQTEVNNNDKTILNGAKTATPKNNIAVESITLNKSIVNLKTGESVKINATTSPSNATNKTLTWSSNNKAIATVDSNGNIKAISSGTARITVKTNNNKSRVIKVNVKSMERIHFIPTLANVNSDGDHGDSILLESNGHYAMIDTGNTSEESRINLLSYLKKLGVSKLDFVLITHLHADHFGGLNYLNKNGILIDTLYIKRYSKSLGEKYESTFKSIIDCSKGISKNCSKIPNIVYTQTIDKDTCPERSNRAHSNFNCTANISLANMKIKLYNTGYVMRDGDIGPEGNHYISYKKKDGEYETFNANYESIYEYLTVNNHKVVLAADAVGEYPGKSEPRFTSDNWYSEILKDSGTNIDVLKAPHHGDVNSDKNFSKLKPKKLVVTNARKKMSNMEGIQDYEKYGARIYYVEYYENTKDLKSLYVDLTEKDIDVGRIRIY